MPPSGCERTLARMAGVVEAIALFAGLATLPAVILWLLSGGPARRRRRALLASTPTRRQPSVRPDPQAPGRRPLEEIASDVYRISERYHQPGMRFAQYEGRRRAFDRVLAEAANVLEIEHLLTVLPPGAELDHERARVEARLVDAGLLPTRHYPT
jgi:hypothetical protein